MQQTAEEGVRHCPECERDVHLALTEEDFHKHSDEGRCIAVLVLQPDWQIDPDTSVYAVGMTDPPN